jgi:hypothetical protein
LVALTGVPADGAALLAVTWPWMVALLNCAPAYGAVSKAAASEAAMTDKRNAGNCRGGVFMFVS